MKVKVYFDSENRYKIYNGDTVINANDVVINEIPIDTALSDVSANAVENKVIKKEFDTTKQNINTVNSRISSIINNGSSYIAGHDITWSWYLGVGNSSNFKLPANTVIFIAIPKETTCQVMLNGVSIYDFGDISATNTQVGLFVTGNITSSDNFSLYVNVSEGNESLVENNTIILIADYPKELTDIRVDYYGNTWDSAGDSVRYGMQLADQTKTELEDVRVDAYGNTWDSAGDSVRSIMGAVQTSMVPAFNIKAEVTYDEVGVGLISHNTGEYSSSYYHKKKAVLLNETYSIRAKAYNYNRTYSAITYLDSNGDVIGYYPENEIEQSTQVLKNHIITITNPDIAYIVINGDSNDTCAIRSCEAISFSDLIDKKTSYLADTPTNMDNTELAVSQQGCYAWIAEKVDPGTEYTVYSKISINPGDIYYITGKTTNYGNRYRVINLLDANGDLLETYPKEILSSATTTYTDFKYIIKNKDAVYLVVNGSPGTLSIKKGNKISVEQYVNENAPTSQYLTDFINMADFGKRLRAGGKSFVWDTLDNGYLTIIFDDGRTDLSTVSDIFEEYNIPLCSAIIPKNLTNQSSDSNRTILDVCNDIVANGGEILAHEQPVLTSPTDYDKIKTILMNSKEQLVNAGFNIRGVIRPGGTGAIDWRNNNLQRFTQMFYDYSDLCGDDPQYYNPRHGLGGSLPIADAKAYIDDAITNNKWYICYAHDLTNTPEAYLREFIEYGIAQGIQFKTYSYMYDNFGNWQ